MFDEGKNQQKTFSCDKRQMLSHMKYFDKFKSESNGLEDLDISVHCDIQVFESLMMYIKNPNATILDKDNIISILISAEYLQMQALVDECIRYFKEHITSILQLTVDMSCLSTYVLGKLSQFVDFTLLDDIKERRDKLISKLYTKRIEQIFEDETKSLKKCVYCNSLFNSNQKDSIICPKAEIFVDFHGSVIACHIADRNWDISKFVSFLRSKNLSWREIHWKIWAYTLTFKCAICDKYFTGAQISHCNYHPQKPKFVSGSNKGVYPCCNAPAYRFYTEIKSGGCTTTNHILPSDENYENVQNYNTCLSKLPIISEPYINPLYYNEQYRALAEKFKKIERNGPTDNVNLYDTMPLSQIKESVPLIFFIEKFMLAYPNNGIEDTEDEDSAEDEETNGTMAESPEQSPTGKSPEDPKDRKKKAKKLRAMQTDMSMQKQKAWRLDALRNDDRIMIQNLIKDLKINRNTLAQPPRTASKKVVAKKAQKYKNK